MEEERSQLLGLFDFYWFHHHVLLNSPLPAMVDNYPDAPAAGGETSGPGEPHLQPRHKSPHRRSFSDEIAFALSSDSALVAHRSPKLQTILSGKAASEEEVERPAQSSCRTEKEAQEDGVSEGHREKKWKHGESRRRRWVRTKGTSEGGKSKSLSELEFEELKGFMDLGFIFSEAESDQRLLSLVPGLQRLGRRRPSSEEGRLDVEAEEGEGGVADDSSNIPRPYLSEAWGAVDLWESSRRSQAHDHLLRNWRVPAAGDGVDMKDHLRSWAHTVASAVR